MLAATLALALVGGVVGPVVAQEAEDDSNPPAQTDQVQVDQTNDQTDGESSPTDAASPMGDDGEAAAPAPAPSLFVRIVEPADDDVEVPLSVTSLVIRGQTLPGATVSVDGVLAHVDDQGSFAESVALEEGANPIDVIATTPDGAQADDSVFVVRGD